MTHILTYTVYLSFLLDITKRFSAQFLITRSTYFSTLTKIDVGFIFCVIRYLLRVSEEKKM